MHALAPPEFRTTDRIAPPLRICLVQVTGAATTLFEVKTAAQELVGPKFSIMVRSRAPLLFKPAATAPALNP
ncbi:unannotated protein [freshwater metagenome]|uniref:Unannotated protein n=1 Tax=freshwater metagenome TaxID=449393 RepID=A0A6J7M5M1_9ZZZZ